MAHLEGVLLLAREPLGSRKLAQLAGLADGTEARTLIRTLNRLYDGEGCAFRVVEVAGGWQLRSRAKFAPWLRRLCAAESEVRLSAPALETLAVVAYRQPILRADIEAIRGVQCGEVLRQLMERDLVRIVGRSDELGRPLLYGTTKRFLEVFGLRHLDGLPRLNQSIHSSKMEGDTNVKIAADAKVLLEDGPAETNTALLEKRLDVVAAKDDEDEDLDASEDEDEDELEDDDDFEDDDWEEVEDEEEEEDLEEEEEPTRKKKRKKSGKTTTKSGKTTTTMTGRTEKRKRKKKKRTGSSPLSSLVPGLAVSSSPASEVPEGPGTGPLVHPRSQPRQPLRPYDRLYDRAFQPRARARSAASSRGTASRSSPTCGPAPIRNTPRSSTARRSAPRSSRAGSSIASWATRSAGGRRAATSTTTRGTSSTTRLRRRPRSARGSIGCSAWRRTVARSSCAAKRTPPIATAAG